MSLAAPAPRKHARSLAGRRPVAVVDKVVELERIGDHLVDPLLKKLHLGDRLVPDGEVARRLAALCRGGDGLADAVVCGLLDRPLVALVLSLLPAVDLPHRIAVDGGKGGQDLGLLLGRQRLGAGFVGRSRRLSSPAALSWPLWALHGGFGGSDGLAWGGFGGSDWFTESGFGGSDRLAGSCVGGHGRMAGSGLGGSGSENEAGLLVRRGLAKLEAAEMLEEGQSDRWAP